MKNINFFGFLVLALLAAVEPAFAEGTIATGQSALIAIGSGLAIGMAALGGTLGQGKAVSAALDSIGRNPSAASKIQNSMIIGLVLVESLVILTFVIAFMLTGKI